MQRTSVTTRREPPIDPKRFTVHALGDSTVEVTEGSRQFGGIWARERYDWSDPHLVVAWVLDSNVFRPGSQWELRARPTAAGGSRVEWASLRQPSSLKGRLVVLVLKVAGRPLLRGYLQKNPVQAGAPKRVSEQNGSNDRRPRQVAMGSPSVMSEELDRLPGARTGPNGPGDDHWQLRPRRHGLGGPRGSPWSCARRPRLPG